MENYSLIQKFLHDLLLSNNFLKKSFFEIEKLIFNKKINYKLKEEKHVFITGLPRSGTTAILNYLYNSSSFCSLTYKNMPFVMAPNLSFILIKKSNFKKQERMHKDGLYFDLDTPESFDEVFFSTFNEDEIKNELLNYINLILIKKDSKRYLSKNNLNYKKIDLIQSLFPKSIFLIPFRNPIQHANSLLNQHKNFCLIQKNNKFVKRYMKYLGHNEFGLNHKSWNKPSLFKEYNNINYWLEQWYKFYDHLFKKFNNNKNCIFIAYENLDDLKFEKNLCYFLDIKHEKKIKFTIKKKEVFYDFDENLLSLSKNLYDELLKISFK